MRARARARARVRVRVRVRARAEARAIGLGSIRRCLCPARSAAVRVGSLMLRSSHSW